MRRHLALMGLIVAVIVGLILLRAMSRDRGQLSNLEARAQPTVLPEVPPPEEAVPSHAPVEQPVSKSPAEVQMLPPPPKSVDPKPNHVVVQATEGAIVVLVRTKKIWETYLTSELRPDKEGHIEFDMTDRERILLYSYKPGAGLQALYKLDSTDRFVRLNYLTSKPLEVVCVWKNGSPVGGGEVSVQFEVEMSSRFDLYGNYVDSTWVKLPTRQAVTDSQGRCSFEGFPDLGWVGQGSVSIPGCRITFTAASRDLKVEKKIDGFPRKGVRLVLE